MGHRNLSRESFANDFVPLNIEPDFYQGHCIEDSVLGNSSYLKKLKSHFLLKKISKSSKNSKISLDHRFLDGDQMVQKRRNVQVIEKIGQYKYLETDYLI